MKRILYTKMWHITFGEMTCSYDIVADNIVSAINKARRRFKHNHTFHEAVTKAELVGKARRQ